MRVRSFPSKLLGTAVTTTVLFALTLLIIMAMLIVPIRHTRLCNIAVAGLPLFASFYFCCILFHCYFQSVIGPSSYDGFGFCIGLFLWVLFVGLPLLKVPGDL